MTKAWKRVGGAAGVAGALMIGGIVSGTTIASADESSTASSTQSSTGRGEDGHRGPRGEELTGDAATQVETAVLAAYPGADIRRSTADPDGGYAAAITTAEDERLLVLLDDAFTVTGTETPPAGRGGGPGGFGEELTGDVATQVETAVLAAYPGADIKRSTTGPDGGYAAAITTAEDERLLVLLDDAFTVTGTETPPAGRGGGPGGGGSGGGWSQDD